MIRKILKNKSGEGYVDLCVGVVVFVMLLVIAINIFSFITLRVEMGQIADELLETATFNGSFGDEFWNRDDQLLDEYFYYDIDYDADEYFNSSYKRVQLGKVMSVTVSVDTYVKGLGVFKIPVTLSVTRSGISQKYWK
ncbi:MAG: DUF4320 family protein [Clostridia bacterium]|nr:DUF4320 family protein [Clostridia bacterium]